MYLKVEWYGVTALNCRMCIMGEKERRKGSSKIGHGRRDDKLKKKAYQGISG